MNDIISELTIKSIYGLEHTMAKEYLEKLTYPWEALPNIKDYILELGSRLDKNEYDEVSPQVWIHKTAKVFASAYIAGPAIIGADTEVRQVIPRSLKM